MSPPFRFPNRPPNPGLFIRPTEIRDNASRLAEYRRRLYEIEDCVRQGCPASYDPPAALYGALPWNGEADDWWRRAARDYHDYHRRHARGQAVLLKILNATSATLFKRLTTNKTNHLKAIK